jgi:hypothetical protein
VVEETSNDGRAAEHGVDLGFGLQPLLGLKECLFDLVVSDSKVGVAEPEVVLGFLLGFIALGLDGSFDLVLAIASDLREEVALVIVG